MKTLNSHQVAEPADELLERVYMSHNDFGRAFAVLLLSRKELIHFDRLTAEHFAGDPISSENAQKILKIMNRKCSSTFNFFKTKTKGTYTLSSNSTLKSQSSLLANAWNGADKHYWAEAAGKERQSSVSHQEVSLYELSLISKVFFH